MYIFLKDKTEQKWVICKTSKINRNTINYEFITGNSLDFWHRELFSVLYMLDIEPDNSRYEKQESRSLNKILTLGVFEAL